MCFLFIFYYDYHIFNIGILGTMERWIELLDIKWFTDLADLPFWIQGMSTT